MNNDNDSWFMINDYWLTINDQWLGWGGRGIELKWGAPQKKGTAALPSLHVKNQYEVLVQHTNNFSTAQ